MGDIPQSQKATLHIIRAIPGVAAILGILSLWLWLKGSSEDDWQERTPAAETIDVAAEGLSTRMRGQLTKFSGVPAALPGAWPRFRGQNADGVSVSSVELLKTWGGGEPNTLWGIDVGEGYAGATILNGRVYLLDYDPTGEGLPRGGPPIGADTLRCLSLADGKEIWRYAYPVKTKRNHGMSRTVPAVTEKYVVALGPKCHVICLDSITGELHWQLDLVKDFGATVPPWYAGQCPLIDDGKAILAPGGDTALIMAADCETGDIIWKTPNPNGWNMTHSSIIPMEFKGKRMYVYCANRGVVGVSADDGAILWETTAWKISIATVPSPLILDSGQIFLSGGYNAGSMMLQLKEDTDRLIAEPLFRLEPEVFGATQQTPILFDNHIYGVRPNGEFICLKPNGELVWTSDTAHRFGLGPFIIANGLIYVMNDSGTLTLLEATPGGYTQLAQSQVLNGHDSWGPMAFAEGRLIVRDMTRMVCLDVSEN